MKKLLLASSALLAVAACSGEDTAATTETVDAAEPAAAQPASAARELELSAPDYWGDWGVDMTAIDESVDPGDDFFMHVNGAWLDRFEIPADRSRYGAFDLLREKSELRVRHIIEDVAAAEPDPDTLEGKIAAVYNAFMDQEAIEARGLAPAKPYLDEIAAVETREDLARLFGSVEHAAPYAGFVGLDPKQPTRYIFQVFQAGLGLPDRDYYLEDSEKNLEIRAAYQDYLTRLLTEAGYDDPGAAAQSVLALETEMAKAHWDRAIGRNRDLTYNLLSKDEFEALAGDFPIAAALEAGGLGGETEFVVAQVTPTDDEIEAAGLTDEQLAKLGDGVAGLMELAATAPLDQWKAYMTARFLSSNAAVLPAAIDEASFDFYGRTLRGTPEQRERWKRAVGMTEGAVGEGVGKVYVERHFPQENKAAMDELVANLRKAMAANLDDIDWMGEETKVEARDKLEKFTPKIGYRNNLETYDTLEVSGDDAFGNAIAVAQWQYDDNISKLGGPIDQDEWFMNPQTVNAYYYPPANEIVFPAAILQPPFFNLSADPAVNYGAIGGVIGHEMGHGFDDQGAKSDGDGVLRNWWTDEDKAAFEKLTSALVDQYNAFCPLGEDDKCVNGQLTLGENIGDLGGLSMAYRAYKISLDTNGDGEISADEEAPVLNDMTGDQRFFMAWAQVWRGKQREDALRTQLITDPHSPTQYRTNGVVRNFDEWYEAFDISEDDALYLPPEERIRIW